MVKLRSLRVKGPPLTLAEAKKILAQAVLNMEDKQTHNPDYKNSVNSIRNVAAEFLKEHNMIDEKMRKKSKDETTPKEILIPSYEKPGPCPCENCRNNSHIPGML